MKKYSVELVDKNIDSEFIEIEIENYDALIVALNNQKENGIIEDYVEETIVEIEGNHNYKFNMYEQVIVFKDTVFQNQRKLIGRRGQIFQRTYCPKYKEHWYTIYFYKEKDVEFMLEHDLSSINSVYFVQDSKTKCIKIGYTSNIISRLKSLQTSNASKLELLGIVKGDRNFESLMHNKFKQYNILGEWFEPSDEILQYIKVNAI